MSHLFILKSNNYVLSADFLNPIQLNPEFEYGLALTAFFSYNSIPNIEEGENTFSYIHNATKKQGKIVIPTGSYEIGDIEDYIRRQLLPKTIKEEDYDQHFILKPNNNTLKCEIWCKEYIIDLTAPDSIGRILGFSKRKLAHDKIHQSDLKVDIVKVRTININCNITTGAYFNDTPSHTLYSFTVNVDPGFAIDEIPRNIIYLPIINKQDISNITLFILDQNFKPVNFQNEEVQINLELKKISTKWD